MMIARGDLATECGWERIAEVQEEITVDLRSGTCSGDLGDSSA
jgi:pyruvate kinase